MAKDATPDELRIVNDNFANENHREIAHILEEEWNASSTFPDLEDDCNAHRSTIQTVYKRYMGVPGDDRTIKQLKDEYGRIKDYLDLREEGEIDLERSSLSNRELELFQEGVRKGGADKFAEGWNRALEQAEARGPNNVPRMPENDDAEQNEA